MPFFEIEDIFVKHLFKSDLYFGQVDEVLTNYKIDPLLQFKQ